jgi:hypothetical protein
MVRAILDGRKTQTRRVVTPQPTAHHWEGLKGYLVAAKLLSTSNGLSVRFSHWLGGREDGVQWVSCRYGAPGDRLWVRETFYCDVPDDDAARMENLYYPADSHRPLAQACCDLIPECQCGDVGRPAWRPSIHMPRWASRLTLEVTAVRVERLQAITQADARAEGVVETSGAWDHVPGGLTDASRAGPRGAFEALWRSINGPASWDANPWAWVVEFRRVEDASP